MLWAFAHLVHIRFTLAALAPLLDRHIIIIQFFQTTLDKCSSLNARMCS